MSLRIWLQKYDFSEYNVVFENLIYDKKQEKEVVRQ